MHSKVSARAPSPATLYGSKEYSYDDESNRVSWRTRGSVWCCQRDACFRATLLYSAVMDIVLFVVIAGLTDDSPLSIPWSTAFTILISLFLAIVRLYYVISGACVRTRRYSNEWHRRNSPLPGYLLVLQLMLVVVVLVHFSSFCTDGADSLSSLVLNNLPPKASSSPIPPSSFDNQTNVTSTSSNTTSVFETNGTHASVAPTLEATLAPEIVHAAHSTDHCWHAYIQAVTSVFTWLLLSLPAHLLLTCVHDRSTVSPLHKDCDLYSVIDLDSVDSTIDAFADDGDDALHLSASDGQTTRARQRKSASSSMQRAPPRPSVPVPQSRTGGSRRLERPASRYGDTTARPSELSVTFADEQRDGDGDDASGASERRQRVQLNEDDAASMSMWADADDSVSVDHEGKPVMDTKAE